MAEARHVRIRRKMRRIQFICLTVIVFFDFSSTMLGQQASSSIEAEFGRPGQLDGVWQWTLPDTPDGLRPTQSWHATASSPDDDIYVAGMDHVSNAALYRLRWREGELQFLGDARSASEEVANWAAGETAQKFHTRPLSHNGKIYVGTMDRSTLDDQYLTRRGFHWYAYDPTSTKFSDLSASELRGSAVAHGNVVTLASDPTRNIIYGAGVPTGEIYRYDVARGRTTGLGRPSSYDQPYVYTGRVMWVDSRGRLYFTATNSNSSSISGNVHYYDPETGFGERRDWPLQEGQALEVGQCLAKEKQCFFSDDRGHMYRFTDSDVSWTYLGQIETPHHALPTYIWLFDVTSDGSKVFVATSTSPQESDYTSLYEFEPEKHRGFVIFLISILPCAISTSTLATMHGTLRAGFILRASTDYLISESF